MSIDAAMLGSALSVVTLVSTSATVYGRGTILPAMSVFILCVAFAIGLQRLIDRFIHDSSVSNLFRIKQALLGAGPIYIVVSTVKLLLWGTFLNVCYGEKTGTVLREALAAFGAGRIEEADSAGGRNLLREALERVPVWQLFLIGAALALAVSFAEHLGILFLTLRHKEVSNVRPHGVLECAIIGSLGFGTMAQYFRVLQTTQFLSPLRKLGMRSGHPEEQVLQLVVAGIIGTGVAKRDLMRRGGTSVQDTIIFTSFIRAAFVMYRALETYAVTTDLWTMTAMRVFVVLPAAGLVGLFWTGFMELRSSPRYTSNSHHTRHQST